MVIIEKVYGGERKILYDSIGSLTSYRFSSIESSIQPNFVNFLKQPEAYTKNGCRILRGVILDGRIIHRI